MAALLARLRVLHQEVAEATRAVTGSDAALHRQEGRERVLARRLATARRTLAGARADAGRLASLQYRTTAGAQLTPYLRALLAPAPQALLERRHLLAEAAGAQRATVRRLITSARAVNDLTGKAKEALVAHRRLATARRRVLETRSRRLAEVEKALATLPTDRLLGLREFEAGGPGRAAGPTTGPGVRGAGATATPAGGPRRALDDGPAATSTVAS
ncbi:hypothetical protein ACFV3R_12875 [Streptomyces sp. NPDC059740]|uniref:hypothetical protein n=1 Tax=Streptomyces sp. NPDC059740 TaxID=3346926 RepID=UPI003657E2D7